MFRINRDSNRIARVGDVRFGELGFSERSHLQEWLAHMPEALGEDLLIIQKEFDGFDDTRERLDLLAIDQSGALVVIENKLDDSGRDVVWQALKYASYCSTLSKSQIADIFQQYLDKYAGGGDSKAKICEFLEKEDFDEVELNSGNGQRVFLVAAEFRKEVTSTALWLLGHRLNIKCFKATLHRDGEDLFLSIAQLIPLPEAEELMIGISEKELEEQTTERQRVVGRQMRVDFWRQTLDALEKERVLTYANVSPGKDPWLNTGFGISGVHYTMVLNKDEVRAEFVIEGSTWERNKMLFDLLAARRAHFDEVFGAALVWDRLDDRKASIIRSVMPCNGHVREDWPAIIAWLVAQVRAMVATFGPEEPTLRAAARSFQGAAR
jgi:hypothetical protein